MPVSVVVGGQYGSEGKGKTTAHLVRNRGYETAVRCGGPNSGHTVTIDGEQVVLQQVPAGVVDENCRLYLAAGCLIDKDVLLAEIEEFGLGPERLKIDNHAVVIQDEHVARERKRNLDDKIGSTCTGTGEAVAARAKRSDDVMLAENDPDLSYYSVRVADRLNLEKEEGRKIVVEGTQGFGLSVYHSPFYPKATSRDTTVAGFLSEVGLGHRIDEVIMVVRTFPIRVPGDSGPFNGREITWERVKEISGYPYEITEHTSVTGGKRRIAEFDMGIVRMAAEYNEPTQISLMGLDYIDYNNKDSRSMEELEESALNFIGRLEDEIGVEVSMVGVGPKDKHVIDKSQSRFDSLDGEKRAQPDHS